MTMSNPRFTAPRRECRACTVHDRLDAVRVCRLANLIAGLEMERLRVVAARREIQRERQVRRTDVHSIETWCGADFIKVDEAFLRFDHCEFASSVDAVNCAWSIQAM